jgi:serine/threonine-protein kinase
VTRVLMAPVRAPSDLRPEVSSALDRIVLRALERDPSKRFLTAEDMADALDKTAVAADPVAVGSWVRTIATPELARRADLLRADVVPSSTHGFAGDGSTDVTEGSTIAAPRPGAPRSVAQRRRLQAIAVAAALVAVLSGWGALSASRVNTARAVPVAPLPSVVETASASAAPEVPSVATALAVQAPPAEPPSSKAPARRAAPRLPPPKPTASAREKLYSRD